MSKINLDRTVGQGTLDVINSALDQSPESGLTVADFRARARLDKVIDRLGPDDVVLELNDADTDTLKKALNTARWRFRAPVIKTLIEEAFGDDEPKEEAKVIPITEGVK